MKSSFLAAFIGFSLALMPVAASAASNPPAPSTRYYLPTTKSFWRNALGARNVFPTGFTADLSDFQVKLARLAGIKAIPVKKFTILSDSTASASPGAPVPWGVGLMLDRDNLTKTSGGKDVTIAVLDTGIDQTHPDLADRVTGCATYAAPGKAFIDNSCDDLNGHGTHMAGIIAADGGADGHGIWGVAPEAHLLAYKVCGDDGQCLSDDIAMAIHAAVDTGANIIVLGLGGEGDSSFVDDALQYAADHDVLVVAAAGNDGPYPDSMDWPARNPLTIAVGALASDRTVAEFSSRGSVELVAPGVNIESTFKDDGYAILSGTSMAAPHVAGLAALVWARDAKHPAAATRTILHQLAQDIDAPGDDPASGFGVPIFAK